MKKKLGHKKLLSAFFISLFLYFISTSLVNAQLNATIIGDAIDQGNNCYTITQDVLFQVGGVWYDNPIDFDDDFTILYQNDFGFKDANGADGMAIVFKSTATPELGNAGGGMGFEGISPSLVAEFDTYQNNDASVGILADPVFDHIAILANGNPFHNNPATNLAGPVQASPTGPNIEDGSLHEIKIEWVAATTTLSVFFDCEERLSLVLDIKDDIFSGDDTVFFGFTGSTGGLSNVHEVCFNSISFVDNLQLPDVSICEGSSIVVDATIPSGVTYSWSPTVGVSDPTIAAPTLSPAVTTTYTVTIADVCGNITVEEFTLSVLPLVDPIFDDVPAICQGDPLLPLPTTSINGITGSWSPALNNDETTTYTFTPDDSCAAIVTLEIVVFPLEFPEFDLVELICEGDDLAPLPTTSNNGFTGTWSPELNNSVTTTYTFTPDPDQCVATAELTIEVVPFGELTVEVDIISEAFAQNQRVEVTVTGGTGNYLYQLDNGPWVAQNVFNNIKGCDVRVVSVQEASGCNDVATADFRILEFPKFFTPNGDAFNETWNIDCLDDQPGARVSIFDRYGKLLKVISTLGAGWDGTYLGNPMPSSDYWFKVEYFTEDGSPRTFGSHFTLKRQITSTFNFKLQYKEIAQEERSSWASKTLIFICLEIA